MGCPLLPMKVQLLNDLGGTSYLFGCRLPHQTHWGHNCPHIGIFPPHGDFLASRSNKQELHRIETLVLSDFGTFIQGHTVSYARDSLESTVVNIPLLAPTSLPFRPIPVPAWRMLHPFP